MKASNQKLTLQKRGIWGGFTIERIGNGKRGYYWIGEGQKYVIGLTFAEARQLCRFIQGKR
jgi:hypothetical protein